LWLLVDRNEEAQRGYLHELPPAGAWHVAAKYDFSDSTALYLECAPSASDGGLPAE
jgi:hypothetical protein